MLHRQEKHAQSACADPQGSDTMPDIVLASASPRRRELMAQAGYQFTVIPACGEEIITSTHPSEVVEELSLQKATEVANRVSKGGIPGASENKDTIIVIGADTVVAAGHHILGKPRDKAQARRMITGIQGNIHQVYTGVTIIRLSSNNTTGIEAEYRSDRPSEVESGFKKTDIRTFHECTDVHVFPMTDTEIESYINSPEPYDKAGAYGIQGSFGIYIEGIRGDYNNVVGLPIARLYHVLQEMI